MGIVADRWLESYRAEFAIYQDAAQVALSQISDALSGAPFSIQLMTARAKDPDSVAEKIERRAYGRPGDRFDDLIGVRVITLFEHEVDQVAERIRDRFEVNEDRSGNKSKQLPMRQVGYRSNHLILQLRRSGLTPVAEVLEKVRVEVQVRSVVAHAWAEIEHSLRYKVGEGVPEGILRRFDALAGTLELVDREFSSIEAETVRFVELLCSQYSKGEGLEHAISTAQLLAALRCGRPAMPPLGPRFLVLGIEDAYRISKVLRRIGVLTVDDLLANMKSPEVRGVVRNYALLDPTAIAPENASAKVVVGAVIGTINRPALRGSGVLDDRLLAALDSV